MVKPVVRMGLTVALATVGFIAFCLIVVTLLMILWWAPIALGSEFTHEAT